MRIHAERLQGSCYSYGARKVELVWNFRVQAPAQELLMFLAQANFCFAPPRDKEGGIIPISALFVLLIVPLGINVVTQKVDTGIAIVHAQHPPRIDIIPRETIVMVL